MNTLRKFRLLFTFDSKTLFIFTEALVLLGWARFLLLFKFATIAPYLGTKSIETDTVSQDEDIQPIKHIISAIQVVGGHTPWTSTCLIRAIAGMKMLERRRIDSTLYLGTSKDENGSMIAHAWLRSGPYYISGADVMKRFVVVEKFAKKVRTD